MGTFQKIKAAKRAIVKLNEISPKERAMEHWQLAVIRALENENCTIDVGDNGEDYQDLEGSRVQQEIFDAVEATDSPVVTFFLGKISMGYMLPMVNYGNESICDYSSNDYMNDIVDGSEPDAE